MIILIICDYFVNYCDYCDYFVNRIVAKIIIDARRNAMMTRDGGRSKAGLCLFHGNTDQWKISVMSCTLQFANHRCNERSIKLGKEVAIGLRVARVPIE